MIEPNSRYYNLETRKYTKPDGSEISYKARRFVPAGAKLRILAEAQVGQGDRLDQITARALGDPLQFWRICDANNAMNPSALVEKPGSLRVPVPDFL